MGSVEPQQPPHAALLEPHAGLFYLFKYAIPEILSPLISSQFKLQFHWTHINCTNCYMNP